MIPLFAIVRLRTQQHRFGLWLPLFIIWLLLLPLVLVLLPFAIIACLLIRMNPWGTIAAGWRLLSALSGTHIEVNDSKTHVLVRIF